jgi:hypothetical protein
LAGYDLSTDRLYGHVKLRKGRSEFLAFCGHLRSLHPPEVRIAIVLDNFSPHLSTKKDQRVGDWAATNNVELAYVPRVLRCAGGRAAWTRSAFPGRVCRRSVRGVEARPVGRG